MMLLLFFLFSCTNLLLYGSQEVKIVVQSGCYDPFVLEQQKKRAKYKKAVKKRKEKKEKREKKRKERTGRSQKIQKELKIAVKERGVEINLPDILLKKRVRSELDAKNNRLHLTYKEATCQVSLLLRFMPKSFELFIDYQHQTNSLSPSTHWGYSAFHFKKKENLPYALSWSKHLIQEGLLFIPFDPTKKSVSEKSSEKEFFQTSSFFKKKVQHDISQQDSSDENSVAAKYWKITEQEEQVLLEIPLVRLFGTGARKFIITYPEQNLLVVVDEISKTPIFFVQQEKDQINLSYTKFFFASFSYHKELKTQLDFAKLEAKSVDGCLFLTIKKKIL